MRQPSKQFALCIANAGNEASLILGKVYRIVPDAKAAKDDLVRIIDESGEDYLYPAEYFVLVELPSKMARALSASFSPATEHRP